MKKDKISFKILFAVAFLALVIVFIAESSFSEVFFEVVDTEGTVGTDNSIALDSQDLPHISYRSSEQGALKYARYDGSQWIIETVDDEFGHQGEYSSIAIDSNDNPHISYYDYLNGDLRYAYLEGNEWTIEVVDSTGDVGSYCSLALDEDNNPHISYYDKDNRSLKYAYSYDGGSTWDIQVVESGGQGGDVGEYTSIAVDSYGYPHISYYNNTDDVEDLSYAWFDGAKWNIEIADSLESFAIGLRTSLCLDSSNFAHISHFNWDSGDLRYTHNDSGVWTSEIVDGEDDVGWYTSIALNQNENPCIAYYDLTNHSLKYAHFDGSFWDIETIDSRSDQDVGRYASLAIDSDGGFHISYYLSNSLLQSTDIIGDLLYAHEGENTGTNIYSISGKVTGDAASGVTMQLTGSMQQSTTTDTQGVYQFQSLGNGDYTITPQLNGYSFEPPSAQVTISGRDETGVDFVATFAGSNNTPPIADAGDDQEVEVGTLVTLNGSGSYDPEGESITFLWSLVNQPAESHAVLSNEQSQNPSFIPDAEGVYDIELKVSDGIFESAPDTVTITAKSSPGPGGSDGSTFSLSGQIVRPPLAGVQITISGPTTLTATTSFSGRYRVDNLLPGDYTIKPYRRGYSFVPPMCKLSIIDRNFIGVDFEADWAGIIWPALYKRIGLNEKEKLSVLRDFRDNVLKKTPVGERAVRVLYRHSDEIGLILENDIQLRKKVSIFVTDIFPKIKDRLSGHHMVFNAGEREEIEEIAKEFYCKASPELRESIDLVMNKLRSKAIDRVWQN